MTAKTAPRNGVPVHVPSVSGWPVTQAIRPAAQAASASYAPESWKARKLQAAMIAARNAYPTYSSRDRLLRTFASRGLT